MHSFFRVAVLCGLVVAATSCQPSPVRTPLAEGVSVELKVLEPDPRAGQGHVVEVPVPPPLAYAEPAFISAADIEAVGLVAQSTPGDATLIFRFLPASISRLETASADRVGREVALVIEGDHFARMTIHASFGPEMRVSYLYPCEVEQAYHRLTRMRPPKLWYPGRTEQDTRACLDTPWPGKR